ncbi:MAG: S49 family peptidase [Calditrichia bacterium]
MEKRWAVEPTFLVGYLETTLNISEDSQQQILSFFGANPVKSEEIFSINGDTAIINIKGILSQDGPGFIDRFFGFNGTGYRKIIEAINNIKANEEIKTVRLIMDTPGGEVAGVDKVWQAISDLSKSKTVIAESHGLIASCGYWIASAANKIIATSPADEIGSIGVVVVAIDFSKSREERGVKVVVIRSANAPNKLPDVSTDKGKSIIQNRVDPIERVFIGRISEGRGIPVATIENDFARGSVLIAKDTDPSKNDALSVGMIDAVESIVSPALAPKDKHKEKSQFIASDKTLDNNGKSLSQEDSFMTLEELMAKHPELTREIESRDKANIAKGVERERTETKARIEKCKPFLISGDYPPVVKNLALDVITGESGQDALTGAVTVIDAQKEIANAAAASDETNNQGETPPETHDGVTTPEGVCGTNEEADALIKKLKK